jgi:acetoin utilization deacetylase AcuC-like enzyme
MFVYYNDHYVASPHATITTTRKSALIAEQVRAVAGLQLVDPAETVPRVVVEQIVAELHTKEYLDALRTGSPLHLAGTSGLVWGPTTYDFALAHSHGVVAAIASVLAEEKRAGTLSSGLHHARPDEGLGYCTLNGLAVGAAYALSKRRRVVIIDFDAHFGGGTFVHLEKLNGSRGLKDDGRARAVQVDVSVSRFDNYTTEAPHYRELVACTFSPDKQYLEAIARGLAHADSVSGPDTVVIYNAGVDPVNCAHFDEPFATMKTRDAMVSGWAGDRPAIFTLAGGYTSGFSVDDIVKLHLASITLWAGAR